LDRFEVTPLQTNVLTRNIKKKCFAAKKRKKTASKIVEAHIFLVVVAHNIENNIYFHKISFAA